ncbi:lipoprotein [Burkholderia multivorans]|nr:lipoprotein [Burkholderia multivorans]
MRKIISAAALALALAGCATYDLSLMPRGPGKMAHGTAKQIDKTVSITIDDRTYDGKFAYVQGGAFTLGTAFSGGQVAAGNAVGISATGNGNVLAQSADGHNLRCVFSFSGWSQAGTGTCLTDDQQLYDLQITR